MTKGIPGGGLFISSTEQPPTFKTLCFQGPANMKELKRVSHFPLKLKTHCLLHILHLPLCDPPVGSARQFEKH